MYAHLVSKGNYKCPDDDCTVDIELLDGQEWITNDQKFSFWEHVRTAHPNLFNEFEKKYSEQEYKTKESKNDRIMDVIHDSNGRINKIIMKYFSTDLNNKEIYQLICIEHKQLQEKLKKIFDDVVAAPPVPQTTASSLI